MIAQLSKKIELKFWDIIIPFLSNSIWLREIINKVLSIYQNEKLIKQLATGVVIACAGFASGFLILSITKLLA